MSYADLAGQSLLLSFPGHEPTPALRSALARTRAAGVILFGRNVAGPAQLEALCATLQRWAVEEGLPPLLVGIDQEGGTVTRLPAPFVTPPSQMAQGVAGPGDTHACALLTGRQLRSCGVNLNFAPVADVNSNPANPVIGIRSFGAEVATVVACLEAALRGYAEAGVIACVKHFPGHGDTSVDSHLGLPVVEHGPERLDQIELAPFAAAVRAQAPAVMSAHVVFRALDPRPATLAPPLLRYLLRGRMGFTGLIFTDALDMRAIAHTYGPAEAAILALGAGADIVMPLGDLESQAAVAAAVAAAYADDRLNPDDGVATAGRLASVRATYTLGAAQPAGLPSAIAGAAALTPALLAELEAVAVAVARRGMTVRDPGGLLPLDAARRLVVVECRQPRFHNAEEAAERSGLLRDLIAAAFPRAVFQSVSESLSDAELDAAVAVSAHAELTLLLTRNAAMSPPQARLAAALAAQSPCLIHVAARSPEDVALLPTATASICLYGDPPVSLRALVTALS